MHDPRDILIYIFADKCISEHFESIFIAIFISLRANIHLGESNRVLPEWRTQIVCHAAPPGRKNNNELLQSVFFDGNRVVPDERLLCYPTRNIFQVDGYLFRSVTRLVKQMCCLLPE